MSTPKRSQGLALTLVQDLTRKIQLGSLAPGDRLPSETTLVQDYGISRTVVREALSRLQAAGLVEARHGIGSFVLERQTEPTLHLNLDTALSVRGILELRLGLETQAAALAAKRRSPEQLKRMRKALDGYQASLGNSERCAEEDARFHRLIAEATDNTSFTEIMKHLGDAMIPRTRLHAVEHEGVDLARLGHIANQEHEAIFNAINRQDPDAARAAMWLHLTNSLDRFKAG